MRGKGPPLLAHGAPRRDGTARRRNVPSPHALLPSKAAHKEPDVSFPALRRPSACQKQRACGPRSSFPSRPLPMSFAHGTGILRALPAFFPAAPTLPLHRGPLRRAQPVAPQRLPISLKKAHWGEGWGPGGRRASCAPAKGPSFPRNRRHPPSCPHLRKRQRIFIIMCWPGDRMAHSHAPRPGAEKARHDVKERVSPLSRLRARRTGERCPCACPGPFFTISPLQPSSRGYYELYQGRCLEISCGAPPR